MELPALAVVAHAPNVAVTESSDTDSITIVKAPALGVVKVRVSVIAEPAEYTGAYIDAGLVVGGGFSGRPSSSSNQIWITTSAPFQVYWLNHLVSGELTPPNVVANNLTPDHRPDPSINPRVVYGMQYEMDIPVHDGCVITLNAISVDRLENHNLGSSSTNGRIILPGIPTPSGQYAQVDILEGGSGTGARGGCFGIS